ncbi:MAG: tyrosine-type recombinase/integrase, partial [Thermoguttaceae bacterium]
MANIYKKSLIEIDPVTKERKSYKTDKWWGQYRDANGVIKRVSLSKNKQIAQQMLAEIVNKVELEKSGVVTSCDSENKKPFLEHIADFEKHLRAKDNTKNYVSETIVKIKKMLGWCQWRRLSDINATSVEGFLAKLREEDSLSVQTSNHYLRAVKIFCNWLVATNRIIKSPLIILKPLNPQVDQRHHRRPLCEDEFHRLVEAAEHGGPAVGLTGADRAMLYIIAAWTGFRRSELGSLTLRHFDLASSAATVRIQAAYSKRRRHDMQVLHPDIVDHFVKWVVTKRFRCVASEVDIMTAFTRIQNSSTMGTELLFPIVAKTGGVERKTSDMIEHDL